jgi:LPXTG-motif cell wall-anchored protein
MRTLTGAGVLTAGVLSAALFLAPAAHATPLTTAPGDNGTVKIHDATTGEELRKNEPHVCAFYLDAFGFDAVQQVDWHIEAWAPTADVKGETVQAGEITLDADGHGRTENLSLPDGHYKLFWNFDGEKGAAKHKVFWTDCEDGSGSGSTPGSSPGSTPGSSTGTASPGADAGADTGVGSTPGSGATADPSVSPSAQGAGGDLAETGNGAPVGLLSGAAALLVAAGGYLLFRRRKA